MTFKAIILLPPYSGALPLSRPVQVWTLVVSSLFLFAGAYWAVAGLAYGEEGFTFFFCFIQGLKAMMTQGEEDRGI